MIFNIKGLEWSFDLGTLPPISLLDVLHRVQPRLKRLYRIGHYMESY